VVADVPGLIDELVDGIHYRDHTSGWTRRRADIAAWSQTGIDRRRKIVIGAYCVTDLAHHVRYVTPECWQPPYGGVTPGELARAYLRHCRRLQMWDLPPGDLGRTRIPWHRSQVPSLIAGTAPLYYDGASREGEWAIVDIDACYASLYLPFGLAPTFYHDVVQDKQGRDIEGTCRSISVSTLVFDRPAEWLEVKAARNALVGVSGGGSGKFSWLERGQLKTRRAMNDCYSPSVVAWCLWCATAIARDMIHRFQFVTWATDGGILPAENAAAAVKWIADAWHLTASVRAAGPGRVWHATCWRVGDAETAHTEGQRAQATQCLDRVQDCDPGWYRDRLAWGMRVRRSMPEPRPLAPVRCVEV
jgi:hypothetical protein